MYWKKRGQAIFQVNSVFVDLYWNIGNYISEKCVKENWGKSIVKELSIYINQKDPNIKGFSDKNIWRMK